MYGLTAGGRHVLSASSTTSFVVDRYMVKSKSVALAVALMVVDLVDVGRNVDVGDIVKAVESASSERESRKDCIVR